MAPQKKNTKIAKYRNPRTFHLNIGIVVFGAIFIYMIVSVFLYLTSPHVSAYEVRQGQLTKDFTYTGIALREEKVFYADSSGYINYYASEGEKVGAGSNLYTIDENGRITETIQQAVAADGELSHENLKEIQLSMENFLRVFDTNSFEQVYPFKNSLNSRVLELLNDNLSGQLEQLTGEGSDTPLLSVGTAPEPGVVVFSVDGMEEVNAESITEEMFQAVNYEQRNLKTYEIVNAGDPIYKLITNEDWSIMIELDETTTEALNLLDSNVIRIRFIKDQSTARVNYTVLEKEGKSYAKLDLGNSMIRFAEERFIELELLLENKTGLKIPKSALVEKDFYLIPEAFVDTEAGGVIRESVDEEGEIITKFIEAGVYNELITEEGTKEYYIDGNLLETGDTLLKSDSNERYTVGKKDQLWGVYNVNKGYAVFKQIEALYENKEYCIVKEGTSYGLAAYDHIALDAGTLNEDDIVK